MAMNAIRPYAEAGELNVSSIGPYALTLIVEAV
ncbi:bacteriophage protein [Burkholderia multivorans ATCC 17616]|uniref:Bacteriophage protein n=1 Tax=Burkholderia multivorans (strain ATCC 17616 / 249) TaxID=395019 RepID=A0A0H3KMN5_BURM1|nr:gp12 [Burkholderia phage Bcep176]ABA60013.1 gp12 [Burkholderia phage Bcep176]BAG46501.1 bacteriophage protein [Burkholderia multivorans ATCC 17616]